MTLFEIDCRINRVDVTFKNFLKYLETLKKDKNPSKFLQKIIAEKYFNKKIEIEP